jgi:Ulp1 family protease
MCVHSMDGRTRGDRSQFEGKKEYFLYDVRGEKFSMILMDEDFEKLLPDNDLNDTIIGSYLRIVKTFMLDTQEADSVHIFSTYLISKLLKDISEIDLSMVLPTQ